MRLRALLLVVLLVAVAAFSPGSFYAEVAPSVIFSEDDKKEGEDHGHGHDHGEAHQPTSTRSFGDVERWKRVFDDPSRDAWQKPEEIPGELGLEKGMTLADIGAGTGYFQRHFAAAVGAEGKVYSVDVEQSLVDHLGKRATEEKTPNVIPVLAEFADPKLPEAAVDVVFICDTWHHIGDRVDYLGRVSKALTDNGVVAVIDYRKQPLPVGPAMDHKIAREEVVAEFEEAGWSLSRESDILPYQYFLIFSPPPGD